MATSLLLNLYSDLVSSVGSPLYSCSVSDTPGEDRGSEAHVNPRTAVLKSRSLFDLEGFQFGLWGTNLPGAILS